MSKLLLSEVPNGVSNIVTNTNFGKIEKELNDNTLKRRTEVGEDNTVHTDIDMNSNRIYNLPKPESEHEPLRRKDVSDAISATEDAREAANKANEAVDRVDNMEEDFQNFLLSSGYQDLGDYEAGLEITARNQIFRKDGELYRAGAVLELPYKTTGDWSSEGELFVIVGDAALRQELADPDKGAAMVAFLQAGAASVRRSVMSKLREAVSVLDFGAVGDGVTDDTVALSNAISALKAGQRLVLPDGDYLISGQLAKLPAHTEIYCDGNAQIRVKSGAIDRDVFYWTGIIRASTGCRIKVNIDGGAYDTNGLFGVSGEGNEEDVIVYDSTLTNLQHGVKTYGAKNWLIVGNKFTHLRNSGVLMGVRDNESSLYNKVVNNHFFDMGDTAVAWHSEVTYEGAAHSSYNLIYGNTAKDTQRITDGYAYDFEGGHGEIKRHNMIINNTVEQDVSHGFRQLGIVMGNCEYGVISGNVLKGNRTRASTGIDIFYNTNTTVYGNNIKDFSSGIIARGSSSSLISTNTITDCGDTANHECAIYIGAAENTQNLTVRGNVITFSGTHDVNNCIFGTISSSYSGALGWIIDGNTLVNYPRRGIYILGTSTSKANGIYITGNRFTSLDSTSYAIHFLEADNVVIRDNVLENVNGGVMSHDGGTVIISGNTFLSTSSYTPTRAALHLGWEAGRPNSDCHVMENVFKSAHANYILPGDYALATVSNNIGYVTESYGDTGNISSGSTISHGLPRPPKSVVITPRGEAKDYYVTGITETGFRIFFSSEGERRFSWVARV